MDIICSQLAGEKSYMLAREELDNLTSVSLSAKYRNISTGLL